VLGRRALHKENVVRVVKLVAKSVIITTAMVPTMHVIYAMVQALIAMAVVLKVLPTALAYAVFLVKDQLT
jgi:hypothetical protein